jgi:hypothetical protein
MTPLSTMPDAVKVSWSLKSLVVTIGAVVSVGVLANVAAGTNWNAIRDEWDRFVDAMERPRKKFNPDAAPVASPANSATFNAAQDWSWPDINIGDIGLPGLTIGDVTMPVFTGPSPVPTRSYTIFDTVTVNGILIVTGHAYAPGGTATEPARSYCYAEFKAKADRIKPWIDLAGKSAGGPIEIAKLLPSQAQQAGTTVKALEDLARTSCRFGAKTGDTK